MPEAEKHPIRNGLIVTVVGGLVLSLIPPIRGVVLSGLGSLWSGITWLWSAAVSDYAIPGWLVLLMGTLSLVVIFRFVAKRFAKDEPIHLKYVEDRIFGTTWRWRWAGDQIVKLWCFCPTCDAQLVHNQDYESVDFNCENCGRTVFSKNSWADDVVSAAEREILRRLRTREAPVFSEQT